MSTTMRVPATGLGTTAARSGRGRWIVFWITVLAAITFAATTVAISIGGSELTKSYAPSQPALQRMHAEANAPVVSDGDVAQQQAALQRLKAESSVPVSDDSLDRQQAFENFKEDGSGGARSDGGQQALQRLKSGY